MLLGANDMRYLHGDVIDDGREVVEGTAVGAGNDRIADRTRLHLDLAGYFVVDDDGVIVGHLEPDRRRLLLVPAHGVGRIKRAIAASMDVRLLGALGVLAQSVDLLFRHVARIGVSGRQQLEGRLAIELAALGLEVRSERTADAWAFVPVDAEPLEAIQNRLQGLGAIAFGGGVVDAQDEAAAVLFGVEPVEQRCADAADVEVAGGAGSKTRANLCHDGLSDSCPRRARPSTSAWTTPSSTILLCWLTTQRCQVMRPRLPRERTSFSRTLARMRMVSPM